MQDKRESGAYGKTLGDAFSESGFEVDKCDLISIIDKMLRQHCSNGLSRFQLREIGGFGIVYDEKPLADDVIDLNLLRHPSVYKAIVAGNMQLADNEIAVHLDVAEKTFDRYAGDIPTVAKVMDVFYMPVRQYAAEFVGALRSVGKYKRKATLEECISLLGEAYIPCIKMERLEGKTLTQYLTDAEDTSSFGLKEKILLSKAISDAVARFHNAGYAHLDIKPDNILVREADGEYAVTLLDCGSGTRLGHLPVHDTFIGSLDYISLEHVFAGDPVARKDALATRQTDIFSLGAVIHTIFEEESPLHYAIAQASESYSASKPDSGTGSSRARQVGQFRAVVDSLSNEEYLETIRFMAEAAGADHLETAEGVVDQIMYRCMRKEQSLRYSCCEDASFDLQYALSTLEKAEENNVVRPVLPGRPPRESGFYRREEDKVARADPPELPYATQRMEEISQAV